MRERETKKKEAARESKRVQWERRILRSTSGKIYKQMIR